MTLRLRDAHYLLGSANREAEIPIVKGKAKQSNEEGEMSGRVKKELQPREAC